MPESVPRKRDAMMALGENAPRILSKGGRGPDTAVGGIVMNRYDADGRCNGTPPVFNGPSHRTWSDPGRDAESSPWHKGIRPKVARTGASV